MVASVNTYLAHEGLLSNQMDKGLELSGRTYGYDDRPRRDEYGHVHITSLLGVGKY